MLLSVHVTSVLFLVRFKNFDQNMGLSIGVKHSYYIAAHSYVLLLITSKRSSAC